MEMTPEKRGLSPIFNFVRFIFLLMVCVSSVAEGNDLECIEKYLTDKSIDNNNLPKIEYSPGTLWFKTGDTPLEEPPHDYKYTTGQSRLNNLTTTYFFNLCSLQGYIQKRGGVDDIVAWYGPFEISVGLRSCLSSLLSDKPKETSK